MQRLWVEKTPVHLATTGQGGGAARRLKARLARENWEVAPGFKFRPGFIYTQVRAISARINQNYDGWPADELEKSHRTFIGKPCFVNHQNENPQEARGVVVASRYVENGRDKYVDVIQEIDAQRFPKLAHEIITGGMDSVSMGAEAAFTICSYCKHKATDEHDMCNHVKFHKGEKLAKFNRRTGKTENVLVYESCHKLSFFELSYVFEPADETAVASRVLVAGIRKEAPFADYTDFAECEEKNKGKVSDTGAYCGEIKHRTEDKKASFEARVLQAVAMGNDCLPGQPCDKAPGLDLAKMPKGTASGAPAAVVTTDSSPAAAGGGGTPVSGEKGANGLLPGTQALNDLLLKQFPGSDIGGYRVDPAYPDEHPAGKALDFMSTNPEQWKQVRDLAFQNGADYVINDNKMWYPGGKTEPYTGPNPHTDHVHIHVPGQTTASFESKVLRMAGYKTTTFEDRVLRAAGMTRLAEHEGEKHEKKDKKDDGKTDHQDDHKEVPGVGTFNGPNADANAAIPSVPTDPNAPPGAPNAPAIPGAPDPAQHGQTQGAPPGPVGAGLENWQLPGGTNPTDPNGLAMPYAQSQVGQWSPTLNHTVTTEDVTGKANQGNIDAWNKANPTNVFDPDMKYDPASMERGVQHVFTKPGPEGAGAPPPPAAPVAPAVPPPPAPTDAASQVGTNTPTVPPLPTPPPPPGPEALAPPPAPAATPTASFERRVLRLAYGEIEAPTPVDTLREEGSAPEDANDDFHHYVAPPDGLRDPDLSQAGQMGGGQGPQPEQGVGGMAANPEDNPAVDANYMVLKIPMPGTAPPGPMQPPPAPGGAMPPQIPPPPQGQPPGIPMQNFASRSLLAGVDQYLGIDAGATTLGNGRGVSQTSRKPRKGQTMGRSRTSLSQRGKVASQGKRQHFAEGPHTDGGPYGRNDEGEQQDVFLTQPPPPEHVEAPDEDTQDISNTKGNLVARVQQGRAQLLRDAQALAAYQAREGSRHQGEALVGGGGVIDPSVQDSESEALTGDHFEALGEAPVRTDPKQAARQAENSLSAFQAFDKWLHSATGRQARHHTAKNIRLAADEWAKRANYDVKVLFPALGIVLRQARKIEAAQTKGAKMRKRADEKLDLAAPDARIDVEAPVANVTDAEAQESQFDTSDFANNAGDSLADPDLSTDSQFWAPGEGSKKSSSQQPRKATPAGGILAVRAAEAYINAGLERPESKYQLAGLFENMNKGVVQRDIALLERVAQLQSQTRQKVASGKTRGAAPSLPAGLSSGGMRVASVQRMAANDPSNDALLFD